MANELTPAQRQALKGRAHALDPVVMIGAAGMTTAVLAEVHRALESHELIKIRVMTGDRHERDRLLEEICDTTGAAPVQHIGKVIVIFRERADEPAPEAQPKAANPAKRTRPRRTGGPSPAGSRRLLPPRRGKLRPR